MSPLLPRRADNVSFMLAERPWEELPALIAPAMRPGLKTLADEMIETIRATVPAYSRPLEGAVAEGVRLGVEGALSQFLDVVEGGHEGPLPERELYAELGRGEAREGRRLEALLAAYRIGARVAWRRAAARARELELDGDMLALLAESIFAYIDELSAASAEGYAREQSATAGEADRRRSAFARLLIQHPPADPAQLELAARDAGTELPERFAAVVWAPREDDRTASWLPLGALAVADGELSYALVPDPDAPMRRLEISRAFGRRTAALGPSVPWQDAARSALRATEVHKLISAGAIAADGLVRAEDHLVTLLLERDPSLLSELAERRLAPLTDATASARGRLLETLEAWLEHQGSVPDVARAIHVHPQTVRYRLNQLRTLFGDDLDDPDARFELMIVTRARGLRGRSWRG
ncbi:MAG: helix-turn-helix domain-containing protein [Solirubrobacteraceae bacterium]